MLDVVDEVVSNIHSFGWGHAEISVGCRRILTDIIGIDFAWSGSWRIIVLLHCGCCDDSANKTINKAGAGNDYLLIWFYIFCLLSYDP